MKLLSRLGANAIVASLCVQKSLGQDVTGAQYTDPQTGISFSTWSTSADSEAGSAAVSPYTFGLTLPPDALTKDASEYIGILRCEITNSSTPGWCGLSHGASGQMTHALLVMAWAYNGKVYTSLRYAPGYNVPVVYTGNATITQISSKVDAASFEVIYRCQGCFSWNQAGSSQSVSTSSKLFILGHAAAKGDLHNPTCPDKAFFGFHNNGFGQYGAPLDNAPNAKYAEWAKLATKTPTVDCTKVETPPTTTEPGEGEPTKEPVPVCVAAPSEKSYDYIIVGAGAGGIPIADKLSAAGKTVLLIEKGPPSSGRWNGTMKPSWLTGTNLTRFDVPGLCNQIWVDSGGIACTDMDQMAGCVLGGGTAVNAGLWWKPHPNDWDYNFPAGWKSKDVAAAQKRVFDLIPGTTHPSRDGKLYRDEGYNVLASGLKTSNWKEVVPNDANDQKNHTFGHTTFMYSGGERGGPMATYLVSAYARKDFSLWMNTAVRRVVRTGGHVTGVELECLTNGGISGVVNLTPKTGRVILAAGTFGSAKLLLRSGIGPKDQLEVVKGSEKDGATFIQEANWINLPVGYNLIDHLNTDLIITHPDVVFYDFYEAWTTPIEGDKGAYLTNRTGILTQSAPNIGPMMWEEIKGSDGIVRTLQWTARVEGDGQLTKSLNAMTLSQYLGRGVVSRGRMTITPGLDTNVFEHPYLHNAVDKEVVIQGIKNLQATLGIIPNLTWVLPPANITVDAWVNGMIVSPSNRRSNHWMGTAKLGTDDGRKANGTAVVDLDTKVYGTDNLFVVDASIFPGMSTGNPSAMIVVASERAAERILALKSHA